MSGQDEFLIPGTKVKMPYPPKLTPAEVRLVFSLQKFFRPEFILADYYLPKVDRQETVADSGQLLQIDCLAVGTAGVLVFESKDYQGWIYGHVERTYWTQVVKYGKEKHQFYSPVKQNAAHVEAVKKVVGGKVPVFSVVVFGRQAELKVVDGLSDGTIVCTQAGLYSILIGMKDQLSLRETEELIGVLKAGGARPTVLVRDEHIEEVERLSQKARR